MITKISYMLAHRLAEKTDRNDEDYIRYGIEVVLSSLSKMIIFLIISLIFNVFTEMFTVIISFIVLRVISGGVHMSTYSRCLTTSLLMFFVPALIFKNIALLNSSFYLTIFVFLFAIITVIAYVPVQASNRPVTPEKHRFFKFASISFLILWFTITTSMFNYFYPHYSNIVFFSAIGILLQTFTLTPFGYSFLESIDRYLSKKERQIGGVKSEKGA